MEDNDAPGVGPVLIPGTWLAGLVKKRTIYCYTQNMKALGLVVSEKIYLFFPNVSLLDFLLFFVSIKGLCELMTPWVEPFLPQGHDLQDLYKAPHKCCIPNIEALGQVVSEKIFSCISIISQWQIMTPPGRACFDPRGMVGRIYKEDHDTLLYTKYESSGSCGL